MSKWKHNKISYYCVSLTTGKRHKSFYVHRLVAEHFIENDDLDKNVVDHIDNDKFNNHFTNSYRI